MKHCPDRVFIYINSAAIQVIGHPVISDKIDKLLESINEEEWFVCPDVHIPETIMNDTSIIDENFFHGVSAYQYSLIIDGGVFINPLLYGLMNQFEVWNDAIQTIDTFNTDVIYIDIPYRDYTYAMTDSGYEESIIDEETYDEVSESIKKIVTSIEEKFYDSRRMH